MQELSLIRKKLKTVSEQSLWLFTVRGQYPRYLPFLIYLLSILKSKKNFYSDYSQYNTLIQAFVRLP